MANANAADIREFSRMKLGRKGAFVNALVALLTALKFNSPALRGRAVEWIDGVLPMDYRPRSVTAPWLALVVSLAYLARTPRV